MSAWLNNSNDSINGNFKKNDCYWGDVTTAYNSTTPRNRMRQEKQIKDRFHKIKKNVGRFCCAYKEVKSIYVSGQNELQLMEKVHATYEADYKEGQFTFLHYWKALRDQPKWHAYLEEPEKPNKTKSDNEVEVRELTSTPNSPKDIRRPEGTKLLRRGVMVKTNAKGRQRFIYRIRMMRLTSLKKFRTWQIKVAMSYWRLRGVFLVRILNQKG